MSVREVSNGRFNGLRVQRTVNGSPVIKHWSYRMPIRKAGVTTWRDATPAEKAKMRRLAEKFDADLLAQQKATAKTVPFDPFKITKRNNTGIRGLNFRLRKEKYGDPVEALFITVTDDEGKLYNRYYRATAEVFEDAWDKAVSDIAKVKHLNDDLLKRMKAMRPKYDVLRRKIDSQTLES